MSLRTIPLCVRTSGPFEPSAGYGPAVSSGIKAQSPDDDPASFEDAAALVLGDPPLVETPHAASAAPSTEKPASCKTRRLPRSVWTSNDRP